MLIHDAAVPRYLAGSNSRDEAIALEYNSGGYGLKEIGEHFGLHYSRVSRIIIRFGAGRRKTRHRDDFYDKSIKTFESLDKSRYGQ